MKPSAVLLAALATLAAGCSSGAIVNTGETTPPARVTSSAPPPPQYGTAHLVNAADYLVKEDPVNDDGGDGYFFSTPSGRWTCAILPRDKAGCQLAGRLSSGTGIAGAPTAVPDGATTAPNAIAVDRDHDAGFRTLTEPEFSTSNPKALPFGKVLAVAGFRCNVQEATGVSCVRELTGKGFTFSTDGYTLQYTDVP